MKDRENVTLALPSPLLRRFRVYAAARNQSMTAIMAEAIRKLVDEDRKWDQARNQFMAEIAHPKSRGTGGTIRWTREELHER